MSGKSNLAEMYSTLQLVKHDPTANAAECDRDVNAPELDQTLATSQFMFGNGLETAYNQSAPEPVDATLETEDAIIRTKTSQNKKLRTSLIILVAAIVAVGIGVGLGLGLSSRRSSSSPPATATLTLSATPTASTPASGPRTTGITSNADRTIINSTSLAAVTLKNGDRRLFFQDTSGVIRESIYTMSTGQWTTSVDNIVAVNAKIHTPLAAFNAPYGAVFAAVHDQKYLFYITTNNSIGSTLFSYGSWTNYTIDTSDLMVAAESRVLSALLAPMPLMNSTSRNTSNKPPSPAFLIFENVNGNVSIFVTDLSAGDRPTWSDISQDFDALNTVPGPFFALTSNLDTSGAISIEIASPDRSKGPGTSYYPFFFPATWGPGSDYLKLNWTFGVTYSPAPNSGADPAVIPTPENFDIASVVMFNGSASPCYTVSYVLNGTSLQRDFSHAQPPYGGFPVIAPESPFPFARLASTSPNTTDNTEFILYHQINDTVFAEDVYDTTGEHWISRNFSISTG